MILEQIILLITTICLAGKDADSYRLKDKNAPLDTLENKRIQRWHRDGVILNALTILPFITTDPNNWYKYILYGLLIRLSVFDIFFNKWAGLPYKFLGSTALVDKLLIKIFGKAGAIKKSLFFLAVLLILNLVIK